jgi:hypothetical protein
MPGLNKCLLQAHMSQMGQKGQFGDILITSGFPLKADMRRVA